MSERSEPVATGIGARSAAIERRWLSTDRILLVAVLGVLVWFTADVLLLVFAGLLIAVGLGWLGPPRRRANAARPRPCTDTRGGPAE
jgi:hypothetical protein